MTQCIVVGAGIAGLLAAKSLHDAGVDVTVVDKGQDAGGRMATRHLRSGVIDYGAQFFTVRSDRFRALVETWQKAGIVTEWSRGFPGPDNQLNKDGYPRYRGSSSMADVPKHLTKGLDVRLNTPVTAVRHAGDRWQIDNEHGETLTGDWLVMTPPVPQSLELLAAGSIALPDDANYTLQRIEYDPCIAVLGLLDDPSIIPEPGAIQFDDEPVRWLADNTRKGISSGAYAITIHGAPQFSREHWDKDHTEAGRLLIDAVRRWLGTAHVREFEVYGWRYSQPTEVHSSPCLMVNQPLPLVFAGDAFAGPRVEGAALSGLAAADSLLNLRAE